MTRANINFIWQNKGEAPRTLFVYHNGDQYPQGIRDFFNVLDFVRLEKWTPKAFKEWINKNYEDTQIDDLGEGGQPRVYYTNGFITDYTYCFEPDGYKGNEVIVWNYAKLIFQGNAKRFEKWLLKQK